MTPNPLEAVADLLRQCPSDEDGRGYPRTQRRIDTRAVSAWSAWNCVARSRTRNSGGVPAESSAGRTVARPAGRELGAERLSQPVHPAYGQPSEGAIDPKGIFDCFLRYAGHEEQRNCFRVGTTEQVVKNYLRKVYDKLGVADRLELALYCLNHRVVDGAVKPATDTSDSNGANGSAPMAPPVATPETVS